MKHFYFLLFLFVLTTGFSQENAQTGTDIVGLKLYPNPVTQNKVFIESQHNGPKQIAIFDVLGTQVLQTTIKGRELNVSRLDKGMYIIRILENNKTATRKLIIK